MKNIASILIILLLAASCSDKKKKAYKPASVGALNTVAVVMETELWEGTVGDKVREYFAASLIGLTWNEPQFNLEHMPPQVFTGMTRHRRAVLYVSIDSVDIAHIKTDLYATPQKVGVLKGRTQDELISNIDSYSSKIISSIRQTELEETQKRFSRSLSKDQTLEEEFNISLKLPIIYKVGKAEENFVWIDREIPKGSMNLIVYSMPGNSFSNDSTFVSDIVKMRDSIGKKYIPGPDIPNKTTYMATEKAFAPYVFPAEIAGRKAAEVRGIWEIENYPMAGPFLSFIVNDDTNNRKLIVEGFTFAPATNKRDYMFELEAIIKTLQIN